MPQPQPQPLSSPANGSPAQRAYYYHHRDRIERALGHALSAAYAAAPDDPVAFMGRALLKGAVPAEPWTAASWGDALGLHVFGATHGKAKPATVARRFEQALQ